MEQKAGDMVKKKNALEKARSALKKGEHVKTPLSIKRKLKPKREKKT
jgi:hypothetical protein